MPQYKDEEESRKALYFLYRNLPIVIFILGVKILDAYMFWPLAIAVAGVLAYGLLGYWIPEKPKQGFPKYFASVVLFCVGLSAMAYLTIWLGWIEEWRLWCNGRPRLTTACTRPRVSLLFIRKA